jgi:FKBP-type peptidyl-prolyl cis-trans isomerase (trigger factor)
MAAKHTHQHDHDYSEISSTIAKTDDGSVQITFSIPKSIINHEEEHVLVELQKTTKIPGFRPGKAPLTQVKAKADAGEVLEHTLQHILPQAFSKAVQDNKLKPALYPRFEILSQDDPWQVRATTCELPEVDLGDYKKTVKEALKDTKKETKQEEKEQLSLEALLTSIPLSIPQMLIEEEVNARLSQLVERIDKLGLDLDKYLASVGKDAPALRVEYETQAKQAITLELILNKVADVEKIAAPEEEIKEALKASDAQNADDSQKRVVASILRRRKVLDSLIAQS